MLMNTLKRSSIVAGVLLSAVACQPQAASDSSQGSSQDSSTKQPVLTGTTVATVNGNPIYQAELDFYIAERIRGGKPSAEQRQSLLDELVNLTLFEQFANEQSWYQEPATAAQLAVAKRNMIAALAVKRYLQDNPMSEAALDEAYAKRMQGFKPNQEYKARHILVKTEAKAKELIKELDKGGNFAELAGKHSTGPSGRTGGDLGWFQAATMVKPFAEAVGGMTKGQHSKTPVKTQFGWHVIVLEDTRQSAAPSKESMREELSRSTQNQRISELSEQLKAKAKIEISKAPEPEPAQQAAPAATDAPAATKP